VQFEKIWNSHEGVGIHRMNDLEQCFSTGGTWRVVWWYARILNYYLFHNSIFKMLIAVLKSFSIYSNVKKNIYKM
jgi:hypothetical protein